jgi:phage I-like protein
MSGLQRVILANPSIVELPESAQIGAVRSWNQIAKTGSFTSNRYGKFAITKQDLVDMLRNFREITPRPPTELPVDYDHLSMQPARPGDGIAAGWFKQLEIREDGNELWGEIEWTPEGAERIRNKEYRFVSPSFVKDHVHKDGKKIGTTLLAAAITNHPFLEGMQALTLYNFSALGDLALQIDVPDEERPPEETGSLPATVNPDEVFQLPFGEYEDFDDCVAKNQDKDDPEAFCGFLKKRIEGRVGAVDLPKLTREWYLHQAVQRLARAVQLSEVGQRVMIAPGEARTMDETGGTFEIVEVVGEGDDAFVVLKDANGVTHKWFRSTELLPASATPMPVAPNLQPGVPNVETGAPGGTPGMPGMPGAEMAPTHPDVTAQVEQAAEAARQAAAEAGASPEEQEAAAEAARQAAMATLEAATPPGAEPVAAAAALGAKETPEGEAKTAVVAGKVEKPPEGSEAEEELATEEAAEGEPTVEAVSEEAPEEEEPLKKAVGALLAKPAKKVRTMSMKFMLRNDQNEEIEVSADQLEAAGIRVVPEGSTAIPTKELSDLRGKVVSLTSRVESLAEAAVTSAKTAAKIELKTELDRLSQGGFILKPNREYAEKKWGESTDLTEFREWAAQFTMPLVQLNKEHGSSADVTQPKGHEAAGQLITLANTIQKEKGISLRDAMIQASAQLPDAASVYRESFAE